MDRVRGWDAQTFCLFAACWPALVVVACMMYHKPRRGSPTRRVNTELLRAFPNLAHDMGSYHRLQTTMRESVNRGQYWLLSALKRAALKGSLLDEHKSESKQRFVQDMDRFWREMVLGQDGAVLKEQLDSLMVQYRGSSDDGNETRERKHRLRCHLSIIRSNVSNETASRIESVEMDKIEDSNEFISKFVLYMDDDVPCSEFVLDVIVRIMYTGQVRTDYFGDSYFDASMLQSPTLVGSTELSKEEEHRLDAWIGTLLEMFAVYQHLQMHNHFIESFIYLQLDELARHGYSQNIIAQIRRFASTLFDSLVPHISAASQSEGLRSLILSVAQPEWNLHEQREIHGDMILELDKDNKTDSTNKSINLHKSVLMARSEYFRNMFLSRMSESNMLRVKLPLCQSYSVLKSYVFYLYHGYMHSEDLGEIGVELIGIAKLMDDTHLMSLCEEAIARRIDVTNIILLHNIAKNMSLSKLSSRCEKMLVYLRETGEMEDIPAFDMNEITEQYLLSYRFQQAECFAEEICNSSLSLRCVFIIDEYPDFWKILHSFLVRNCGIEEMFDQEYLSTASHTIRFKDSSEKEVFITVKFDAILTSELAVEHRFSLFEPSHLFFVTSASYVTEATLQQAIELCDMIPHRFADRDHFFTLVVGDRHISPVHATIPTRLINYCEIGPIEDSSEVIDRMFFSALRMGIYHRLSNRVVRQKAMKPILYLYNTGSCDMISISLKDNEKEDVEAVYPHYHCPIEKRWQVRTASDGTLIDATNNRKLQYIFWETVLHYQFSEDIRRELWEYSKGVYSVSKPDYIPFLEQCLEQLGMSERESNDFIVYWLTQLNQKENCLIKFETDHMHYHQSTEFCSSVECLIEPTPNQYIRVMMLFKEGRNSLFDWSEDRVKKELPTIQRIDSTMNECLLAVEWGGRESFD